MEREALEALFHCQSVGIALIDLDLRYVRVNDAIAAITLRPVDEHVGQEVGQVLPNVAETIVPVMKRVIETGKAELRTEVHGNRVQAFVDYVPIHDASGQMMRTLPDGESSGSVVAALLPAGTHYVKAFGTLGADALAVSANRDPLAVLFYATDDDAAEKTIERLIRAAGFEPWKAGGVAAAGRIEAPGGDLHQYGFNGEVVDIDRARSATAGSGA